MPIIESTSDQKMVGDYQDQIMESWSLCPHVDEFYDAEKDGFRHVHHKCKFADMYNRCIKDHCFFDTNESPKIAHKHWINCAFCGGEHSIDPKQMAIPVCDKCLAMIQECLHMPFTCMKCGAKQKWFSKAIFSRLCDECWSIFMFNDACVNWELAGPVEPDDHHCCPGQW